MLTSGLRSYGDPGNKVAFSSPTNHGLCHGPWLYSFQASVIPVAPMDDENASLLLLMECVSGFISRQAEIHECSATSNKRRLLAFALSVSLVEPMKDEQADASV